MKTIKANSIWDAVDKVSSGIVAHDHDDVYALFSTDKEFDAWNDKRYENWKKRLEEERKRR